MKKKNRILRTVFIVLTAIVLSLGVFAGCGARSAYDLAKKDGYSGSLTEWIDSLKGKSAYQLALESGMTDAKSEEEWLASLKVGDVSLEDLFELYLIKNPDSTLEEFITLFLSPIPDSAETASQRAIRTVVTVQSRFEVPVGDPKGSGGGGVILGINRDTGVTYIVTNYHVIYNNKGNPRISDNIQVSPYGKEYFPDTADPTKMALSVKAVFIGGSMSKDIAVLRTVANSVFRDSLYLPAEIADSDLITVGESVLAAGNPANGGISVTRGIISVDSEMIQMSKLSSPSDPEYHRVMRVDAAINKGNSGGGLFDKHGRLIGIVNAKTVDVEVDNIGYAIPSNVAIGIFRNVVDGVREGGTFVKYRIGVVTEITGSRAELVPGGGGAVRIREEVIVSKIESGAPASQSSPAERLENGDVLLKAVLRDSGGALRAQPIDIIRNYMLGDYLFYARRDDVLELTVLRNGQERVCRVVISQHGVTSLDQL